MIICLEFLVIAVDFVLPWGVKSLYEREIWARVDHGCHSGFLVFSVTKIMSLYLLIRWM